MEQLLFRVREDQGEVEVPVGRLILMRQCHMPGQGLGILRG